MANAYFVFIVVFGLCDSLAEAQVRVPRSYQEKIQICKKQNGSSFKECIEAAKNEIVSAEKLLACDKVSVSRFGYSACLDASKYMNVTAEKILACEDRHMPSLASCLDAAKNENVTAEKILACHSVTKLRENYNACLELSKNKNFTTEKILFCKDVDFSSVGDCLGSMGDSEDRPAENKTSDDETVIEAK